MEIISKNRWVAPMLSVFACMYSGGKCRSGDGEME